MQPEESVPPVGAYDWEGCYQRGEARWDKGEPAPGLVDFLAAHPELPRGSVLVPGCGAGHDARAWAAAGWRVLGLDVAPTAVRLARERARAAGLEAEFQCGDFLTDPPLAQFDWLFEHTLFCAIPPAQREAYTRAVARWLRPGGHFLAIYYLDPAEPAGPPWGVTRAEIGQRFAPDFALLAAWEPRSWPNRTGREWMCWWQRRG
jgi:SAM-dependent methyltransferase